MAKTFKIGGKNRKLSFGLCAIEIYCEKMGGDIEQLDKIFKTKDLELMKAVSTLIWAAMMAACELEGSDMDFSFASVKQAVGDLDQSVFEDIMIEFKNSRYLGHTIADYYYTPVEQDVSEAKGKSSKKK